MLCNWCSSEQLHEEWSVMCENGEYIWNNQIEMVIDEPIDFYVIINQAIDGEYYDPSKTLLFPMEPWVYDESKQWGVKTWGKWASPNPAEFFHIHQKDKFLNPVQWQIPGLKSKIFEPALKQNRISSICSSKLIDTGHILRTNFINYMEQNGLASLDVYGKENYHGFTSYKGPLNNDDKMDGFENYKYYFMAENNSEYNYATEKIWEPILCECLCFYWGCPNLEDHIDSNAFIRLDLENKEESLKIVVRAIKEDWWSQRIDCIRREKQKILHKLGFFPTLQKLLEVHKNPIMFFSQDKQDEYLETNIFKGFKGGVFMDIGAHDGITLNNTLYFEKYNGWSGINVEANKTVYDKLCVNRPNSINIDCAVCNNDGVADFICNTGYTEMISGLKIGFDERHYNRLQNEILTKGGKSEIIQVNTKKVETICKEHNISHIHYLSIDVEGAEYDVIKSIDLDSTFIDVIGFENNYNDVSLPIIAYLEQKNYKIIHKSMDIFMIHKESQFLIN
jgi:FkbM family methyltransferase